MKAADCDVISISLRFRQRLFRTDQFGLGIDFLSFQLKVVFFFSINR